MVDNAAVAAAAAAHHLPPARMTIGMKVDAVIEQLEDLSSTQLYALIVTATVIIAFYLLGSAQPTDISSVTAELEDATSKSVGSSSKIVKPTAGPEPRWHIFRWVNYVIVATFLCSLVYASLYFETVTGNTTQVLQILTFWSIFLCYFFGFFGVSFVHDMERNGSSPSGSSAKSTTPSTIEPASMLAKNKAISNEDEHDDPSTQKVRNKQGSIKGIKSLGLKDCSSSTEKNEGSKSEPKEVHPPACSAPVCSDPSSFASSTSSSSTKSVKELSDSEIAEWVLSGKMKDHELEKRLDAHRAVTVRRLVMDSKLMSLGRGGALDKLPSEPSLDYGRVYGANCEIVVGYVPIPVGLVGPLTVNGETVYVPMATTEGCLVASTNRGAKAITAGGGAVAEIVRDGITRAPCVRMASAKEAARLKIWCETPENFAILKNAFESTTSFGKLQSCSPTIAGKNIYLRLCCFSGDAMGMNMVSKGSLAVIETLKQEFPSLQLVALSGNMCTDKKAAATNWIEGRGKSVVVEATVPKQVVQTTLKTTVKAMVETNLHKNLVGSAMAGAMGGFNAHASNIVTAVFLATGQDPAQNVESSNCITLLEETPEGDLWISCTMPSLEVGTVGGGTSLPAQAACLQAMGCKGGSSQQPGEHAQQLARIVASATMAGELSLLAALAANTLVAAHMQHNRKSSSSKK